MNSFGRYALHSIFVGLACGSPLMVTSCGSSSSGVATSKGDAGSPTSTTLRVLVVSQDVVGPNAYTNAVGAAVGIDKPGGTHEDATSDANGMVTFSGLDWSLGNAAVLGTLAGRVAYAVTDLNPGNFASMGLPPQYVGKADVILYLENPAVQGPVTLTANWQNKAAASNYVYVGATNGYGQSADPNPSASFTIGNTSAYSLVTREYAPVTTAPAREFNLSTVRWARFDEPQATGATIALSLDVATGGTTLTPATSHAHVVVPGGQAGPLANCVLVTSVTSVESDLNGFFGHVAQSTVGADQASFDVTTESVSVAGQTPVAQYSLHPASSFSPSSSVSVDGAPQDGATIANFLIPIDVKYPSISLSKPIDLSGADPASSSELYIPDANGNGLLTLAAPPGTTAMHLPTFPAALKTNLQTAGKASLDSGADGSNGYLHRFATSVPFAVTP